MGSAIPEANIYDHQAISRHEQTVISEMLSHRLQDTKSLPNRRRDRIEQLVRENGALRGEALFYRSSFEDAFKLTGEIYEISKQLMLVYYFNPRGSKEDNEFGYELALELQSLLDKFHENTVKAQEEWMLLWSEPKSAPAINGWI